MDSNQCFMLATIIMLLTLIIAYTYRGFKIRDLKFQRKELYGELDKIKDKSIKDLKDKDTEIENLKQHLANTIDDKNMNELYVGKLHESFKVEHDELENAIFRIKKACKVSNKNKKILMKELNSFLMSYYSSTVFDDLKENKLSVSQNVNILKQFYIVNKADFLNNDDLMRQVPNSLLTLILYNSKS